MASIFGVFHSGVRVVVLGLRGIEPNGGALWQRREEDRLLYVLLFGTGNNEIIEVLHENNLYFRRVAVLSSSCKVVL